MMPCLLSDAAAHPGLPGSGVSNSGGRWATTGVEKGLALLLVKQNSVHVTVRVLHPEDYGQDEDFAFLLSTGSLPSFDPRTTAMATQLCCLA